MQSFLDVNGLYTPGLRFAFTNITDEEFTSYWNKIPVTVKPRETIELSDVTPFPGSAMGQNLAIKMTSELVDKIMIGTFKLDEIAKNQPYYRSPQASSLGVPAARKVWEDQILRQMEADEESPALQLMRAQLKQEILSGNELQPTTAPVAAPRDISEFSEIKKINIATPVEEPKKPAKTKVIK